MAQAVVDLLENIAKEPPIFQSGHKRAPIHRRNDRILQSSRGMQRHQSSSGGTYTLLGGYINQPCTVERIAKSR